MFSKESNIPKKNFYYSNNDKIFYKIISFQTKLINDLLKFNDTKNESTVLKFNDFYNASLNSIN